MRSKFKRPYTEVALAPAGEGLELRLDETPAKTPEGRTLTIPSPRLAEAVAAEWRAQGDTVDLAAMPLTRLVIAALDQVAPRLGSVQASALRFGPTDLLCYRAAEPEKLAARQVEVWQPYLDWAETALGAPLLTQTGIIAVEQPEASLAALADAVGALDAFRLLALHGLTQRFGSLILALSVVLAAAPHEEAFAASRLDESYQEESWGSDHEAAQRSTTIAREVAELAYFLSLLS
jgi:chaperone required for assembly of F1-ATPase